jgi:hypothetical protein
MMPHPSPPVPTPLILPPFSSAQGRRKADGKTLAVKKIECDNFDDANQALTEGKMLLELDHQHVIKYYDFFLHQEKTGAGDSLPKANAKDRVPPKLPLFQVVQRP